MLKLYKLVILIALLIPLSSSAGNSYLSLSVQPESVHTISLENQKNSSTTVFLQSRKDEKWTYRAYNLGPFEKKKLVLEGEFGSLPFINLKTRSDARVKANLSYHSPEGSGARSFNNTIGNEIVFPKFITQKNDKAHLFISNLSPQDGDFKVVQDGKNETFKVKKYTTTWLALNGKSSLVRVLSENKFKAHIEVQTASGRDYLHGKEGAPVTLETPMGVYFLLTHRSYPEVPDSFVVRIKDPALIAKAREQIQNPEEFMGRILVASVQSGNGNHNRNMTNPGRAPWGWSALEVYGFAELASQACDGNPQMVEEDLENWINFVGRICFWNYNISRELSAGEVSSGLLGP